MAFVLLLTGYLGYVRVFALVVAHVAPPRVPHALAGPQSESETKRRAIRHAAGSFGPGHWSAAEDLQIRYYNAEKGYWMYAKEYERLNDGKRIRLRPFAIIWSERDGKGLKTATSDEAVIDLDKAIGAVSGPGDSALHILHAQLSNDVRVRDNKGTPHILEDDLLIGPMPYVEYDEPSLQIRSDSDVVIQDRDMRITGFGLQIFLRPKAEGGRSGFNGAKTAVLKKNIHIVIQDVGPSGVLPGKAKATPVQGGRTQLDLRSQGRMQIDLPEPKLPVRVGPPAPPAPTYANFANLVRVLRGNVGLPPDQLDCDNLRLTLLPAEKPASPSATEPVGAGGPMTELVLREALATGHAVWLQSEAQGIKSRCNELIYNKLLPESPDKTYLRSDLTAKLYVEKLELVADGPRKGQVASVTTIRAMDATLFDHGQGGGPSTIVSRGPGLLETRPARDKPVERIAVWEDTLESVDEIGPDKQIQKKITLTGKPKFVDLTQATNLQGRQPASRIIVWLKPKSKPEASAADRPTNLATAVPKPEGGAATPKPADPASGAFRIDRLLALDDVRLTAPGQEITAPDHFAAEFVYPPDAGPTLPRASPAPAAPPSGPVADANAGPRPPGAKPDPQAPAKDKPDDPDVVVKANRVWARILMQPSDAPGAAGDGRAGGPIGGGKGQIQEVRLRGAVDFHQDPAPGKSKGTDVTGEAVDLVSQGDGKSKFKVFNVDPTSIKPRRGDIGQLAIPFAKVETDEFNIEGPVIGLDQKADQSWVDGGGKLTQMAERGLLTDKGLTPDTTATAPAKAKAKGKGDGAESKKVPMVITWKKDMRFFGQATDLKGKPAARAEFSGSVIAQHGTDGLLLCEDMITYMDRTVTLARPRRDSKAADVANEPEPKPQIAIIDCFGKVRATSRKVDANGKFLNQQRIESEHITYEKLTGEFEAFGEGMTYLYDLDDREKGPSALGDAPARRTITPVADPGRGDAGAGRTIPVIGRNTAAKPATKGQVKANAKDKDKAKAKASGPPALMLTQIRFHNGMRGRFGSGNDGDRTETRRADFFKDVEAMRAKVANLDKHLNPDAVSPDAFFLTADILRVVSEPPADGGDGPSRNFLKAWENVNVLAEDKTIQSDILTYDSLNELFYAYGEEGRQVTIAQQAGPGQPASVVAGRAVRYNRKTGEKQLFEPGSVSLLDNKTGTRPTLVGPPGPAPKPAKPTRTPYKAPARKDQERRGFNGR